jgi:hypothetical protein
MAKINYKRHNKQYGSMLVLVIVATGLFFIIVMGAINLALLQQKLNIRKIARAQALHIAEAGVNYYRWLLYHEHEEFCNNEACKPAPDYGPYGPYAYTDSAGGTITGYYNLYITPPAMNGSTVVKVVSEGWTAEYPNVKRRVEVRCGIASWTTYATLVNTLYADGDTIFSYGAGSEVYGPVHANNTCIRNNGIAHHLMTSSKEYCPNNEWGVYTDSDPSYPTPITLPEEPNFLGGRDYGPHIPIVSFDVGVGGEYLNKIFAKATSSDGILIDPRAAADSHSVAAYRNCIAANCDDGFHITFKADNKFDVRMVSARTGTSNYSIQTQSSATEFMVPANGVIFVMHNVWVDGQLNYASGTRATIYAFKDPINNAPPGDCETPPDINMDDVDMADIIISDNLRYHNYEGLDSLGLVAQRHVTFADTCSNDLRVDAALLARWGKRFSPNFSNKYRAWIYGQTASNCKPSMSDGFDNRVYEYDYNLTFSPPPHYPSSGQYTFISWKEY